MDCGSLRELWIVRGMLAAESNSHIGRRGPGGPAAGKPSTY